MNFFEFYPLIHTYKLNFMIDEQKNISFNFIPTKTNSHIRYALLSS